MTARITVWIALLGILGSGSAMAQSKANAVRNDENRFGLRAGLGFTADPGTFLSAVELTYGITRDWTVGPLVQVGVDDHETLVAATLNSRFFPDLGTRDSRNEFVRGLQPFLQGGLGLFHIDLDRNRRDIDDTAFLFNMGLGVDFPITERLSVGSSVMFNVIPGGALRENFFFSWQLATVTARF